MKFLTLAGLLLLSPIFSLAQGGVVSDSINTMHGSKKENQHRPLSMTLSFFNHSISVPFHKMISEPLHPGIQAGIEGSYFETRGSRLFQTLNIGAFNNKYNGIGFYLNTELAYRFTSTLGIYAETLLGLGYLRTYHPTDIYELNSSGTYEKVKDKGFSSPLLSFAIGVGYVVKSTSSLSFAPFIRYESMVQTRYSADLDVLPQTAFHVGVRMIKKRAK